MSQSISSLPPEPDHCEEDNTEVAPDSQAVEKLPRFLSYEEVKEIIRMGGVKKVRDPKPRDIDEEPKTGT